MSTTSPVTYPLRAEHREKTHEIQRPPPDGRNGQPGSSTGSPLRASRASPYRSAWARRRWRSRQTAHTRGRSTSRERRMASTFGAGVRPERRKRAPAPLNSSGARSDHDQPSVALAAHAAEDAARAQKRSRQGIHVDDVLPVARAICSRSAPCAARRRSAPRAAERRVLARPPQRPVRSKTLLVTPRPTLDALRTRFDRFEEPGPGEALRSTEVTEATSTIRRPIPQLLAPVAATVGFRLSVPSLMHLLLQSWQPKRGEKETHRAP